MDVLGMIASFDKHLSSAIKQDYLAEPNNTLLRLNLMVLSFMLLTADGRVGEIRLSRTNRQDFIVFLPQANFMD